MIQLLLGSYKFSWVSWGVMIFAMIMMIVSLFMLKKNEDSPWPDWSWPWEYPDPGPSFPKSLMFWDWGWGDWTGDIGWGIVFYVSMAVAAAGVARNTLGIMKLKESADRGTECDDIVEKLYECDRQKNQLISQVRSPPQMGPPQMGPQQMRPQMGPQMGPQMYPPMRR